MAEARTENYGAHVQDLVIRPMRGEDVSSAEVLSGEAFLAGERAAARRSWPEPQARSAERAEAWRVRTARVVASDGPGCWVADDEAGEPAGFAVSLRRDGIWILSTFAVRTGLQGRGLGRRLLDAALTHSRGCLHGMLSSSCDPRAVRRYVVAGFTMHPQMFLTGTVDRSALPVLDRVREGSPADRDLAESVDRATRGAGHGPDHDFLAATTRMIVSESGTARGYAYLTDTGAVALLGATDRRRASALLWTALADGPAEQTIAHVSAANAWAVEIGVRARLDVTQEGYLGLRGMKPPTPYLHHGALL